MSAMQIFSAFVNSAIVQPRFFSPISMLMIIIELLRANKNFNVFKKRMKKDIIIHRVLALRTFFAGKINEKTQIFGAIVERQVNRNEVAMELMYSVVTILSQYTENIVIFDPKLKFSSIGQQYVTKNKAHKKQSIQNMYKMLATNKSESFTNLKTVIDTENKRDDIADSFNQLIIQMHLWNMLRETLTDIKQIYNQETPAKKKDAKETRNENIKIIELDLENEKYEISQD